MSTTRSILMAFFFAAIGFAPALAEDASFEATGRLTGSSGLVKAMGISPGGSVVVGDAVNANGKTVAFVWTAAGGLHELGFLPGGNQESHAADIAVAANGDFKICGYGKDSGNNNQAFLWTGDATGTGTFMLIPRLSGGSPALNDARALVIETTTGTVYVTGVSSCSETQTAAYRWRSDSPSGALNIGYLNGSQKYSQGNAIAWTGQTEIAGTSRSQWDGGASSREAAVWNPTDGITGQQGLTRICGRGWQILAGPNGVADTVANSPNIQITPPGTSGLTPDTVVVSAGPNNILIDVTAPLGDDVLAPSGLDPTNYSGESIYRAMSANGRYQAGDSNFVGTTSGRRMAFLHDIRNRDYEGEDHCGGFGFAWPLGFLTKGNDGVAATDNNSQANGVSNGAAAPSRNGLTVVGWSEDTNAGAARAHRAFICLIQSGLDIWFLRQQGADPWDNGAPAATQFRDMRNLQYLLAHDFQLNLAGWNLREATAVSDDGNWVVGWGLHNGVEEGFRAYIPNLPAKGACCHKPSLECTSELPADCAAIGGTFMGADTVCEEVACCPEPFADSDQDGDIDMVDFARFQACITTGRNPQVITPGCACWDYDGSGTIDDVDFVHGFENCATGAGGTADPNCH